MLVAAVACGGSGPPGGTAAPSAPSASPASAGPLDEAGQTYGYPASPTGVDYQPDVVVVQGGARAIKGVSGNGVVWTIAGDAPGAKDLRVGKVMLMTSTAAGRVAAIRDDGGDRVVTLAPVGLGEVVRNGQIDLTQAVPASAVRYQQIPDAPWASDQPGEELPSPEISPAAYRSGLVVKPATATIVRSADQPPASESKLSTKIGDWELQPTLDDDQLGLEVARDGDLKVGVKALFSTADLTFHGIDTIKDGRSTHSGFEITGITGLTVSLEAGAAGGSADNEKVKFEVPIEAELEIPPSPATAGLPMVAKVEFTFSAETAITGNNSTLVATGKWKLDGPIGYNGTTLLTPDFSVEQSILDSVSGITLGPSGFVFALEMKFQLGVGISIAEAGPFTTFTLALGITNGSSLGAALARCKGATLDLDASAGVGIELSAKKLDFLKGILGDTKYEYSLETPKTNLLHRSQVIPDVPLCGVGA